MIGTSAGLRIFLSLFPTPPLAPRCMLVISVFWNPSPLPYIPLVGTASPTRTIFPYNKRAIRVQMNKVRAAFGALRGRASASAPATFNALHLSSEPPPRLVSDEGPPPSPSSDGSDRRSDDLRGEKEHLSDVERTGKPDGRSLGAAYDEEDDENDR